MNWSTNASPKKKHCLAIASQLEADIKAWLARYKHVIGRMVHKFISKHINANSTHPFGQFYVLYKVHKGQNRDGTWPTRPVCSDVSSIPHGLGKWVAEVLNPLAEKQDSYFKDSFALKALLDPMELPLPPNALLFTSDATSMYTNIQTEPAIEEISNYILSDEVRWDRDKKLAVATPLRITHPNP